MGAHQSTTSLHATTLESTKSVQEEPGFGYAIALRGERLAIGQPGFQTLAGPAQEGRVGLFRVSHTGAVTREAWLVVAHSRQYARLGSAVALGPDYVAAGAPRARRGG
jgi:hypothetical protein